MAVTKSEIQVTWPTSSVTSSVTAGSSQNSEVFAPNAAAFSMVILLKADNNGTPAVGDTVDFYLLVTTGDPDADADSADEYSSDNHGEHLVTLDTNTDNPALTHVHLPFAPQGCKIRATNNAATNAITVSAQVEEMRA